MKSLLRKLSRILAFLSEPKVVGYVRQAGKLSLASFRMVGALRSLRVPVATVFDVGANEGQFAGAVGYWYPAAKIISFEPSPATFKKLQVHTKKLRQATLEQTAVGDKKGTLDFYVSKHTHASSALVVSREQAAFNPDTAETTKISVPVTTLADYAAGKSWPKPLLLKLDVQGFERKVLEGMGSFVEQVDYLLFECSYRPMYENEPLFAEMHDYVRGLGFEIVAPVGYLEDDSHVMVQTDLLWKKRSTMTPTLT